ncbi:MAG: SgcJ/EcaC family oxidoreductase [Thermoanaerobaculia bacterium]|nr:SgcJ/EcaC family oxidoreductase [Thermoanaerobaculia bacterium]
MKRVGILILVACAVLAAGGASAADTGAKAVDAAFVKAFLAGDAAAAAACYADNAVLVLPGSPAIKGGKAIAEAIAQFLSDVKVTEFVLMDTHYRTAGRLSAGWGHFKMTTVPKAGGAAHTDTGTFCDVASEKDGVWKYVSDHASTDPPPPAAAPAKK